MKSKNKNILTLRQRIDIESKYYYGESIINIAKYINKDRSTVYREINNKPRTGKNRYRADIAHKKALNRITNRGNISKIKQNKKLKIFVIEKLKLGWSPEQIAGDLKENKTLKKVRISHEAIYQYVYNQIYRGGNGYVKKNCEDLRPYLVRRHHRRTKKGFRKTKKAERIANLPSIEDGPKEVEKRKVIGHWEDDFLVSKKSKACIKSVNERKSGIFFFGKTINGKAVSGDQILFEKLEQIPSEYLKTLTRDNGSENKNYLNVEKELGLKVYFAHPYASYERGSNENGNGLLRRFFPKGTDWSKISNEEIAHAEYLINTRPRKRLGWKTPAEVFYQETGVALFS